MEWHWLLETMSDIVSISPYDPDLDYDVFGTPCPCCGYDIFEDHVCNLKPTQLEKDLADKLVSDRRYPNLWSLFCA